MENVLKSTKGITLIALVITIIVLLILAGVSIAMLTGENGILTQAQKAKEETEKAQQKEETTLGQYESYINQATNTEAVVGEVVTGGNKPYTNNGTAIIPEGFIIVPGCNDVSQGLVISDNPTDTEEDGKTLMAQGNQFVWVPVNNFEEEFVRREGYSNGVLQTHLLSAGEANAEGINNNYTESEATQREAQNMYASVKKYGGFYIGRYEAGKEENGSTSVKKGLDAYYNVKWSSNGEMQETQNTEGGAVEYSRSFGKFNNYTSVTSTLVYGVQWDATINWIKEIENINATSELTKYIQDSTGMGWYSDNYQQENLTHKTGLDLDENKSNCVKNIYDLAGNVREWTMESWIGLNRIHRGGGFDSNGFDVPSSNRGNSSPAGSRLEPRFSYSIIYK